MTKVHMPIELYTIIFNQKGGFCIEQTNSYCCFKVIRRIFKEGI